MLHASRCGQEALQGVQATQAPGNTVSGAAQCILQSTSGCRPAALCALEQEPSRQHYEGHQCRARHRTRSECSLEVMFNPHFLHLVSPYPPDVHLGAADGWAQVPALLVIDFFAPQLRRQVFFRAGGCPPPTARVWVLRQHKNNPDDESLNILRRTARLFAELPKKSKVLHRKKCWETAAWDVKQSRYVRQRWCLDTCPDSLKRGPIRSGA
jgi:hypothetical protein